MHCKFSAASVCEDPLQSPFPHTDQDTQLESILLVLVMMNASGHIVLRSTNETFYIRIIDSFDIYILFLSHVIKCIHVFVEHSLFIFELTMFPTITIAT